MNFTRKLEKTLFRHLQKKESFLLFGPRQTGKSTLIESLFTDIPKSKKLEYYFQLPQQREQIENDPETILNEVRHLQKSKDPIYVFIDEIQKIPKVLDVLQFLIDKKMILLAATGSSARQMRKFKANWLPGRVRYHELSPLTYREIKTSAPHTTLSSLLILGTLPGILTEPDFQNRAFHLDAYTHLYLDEEIRAEAVTRNLPRFTKFLRLAALESGTAPNYSKIAQSLGTSHTTIAEYFQILSDTLITHTVPAFGTKRDQVLKQNRYYFFDRGVRNAAAQLPLEEGLLKLQMGVLLEHFIVLETFAHFAPDCEISYFRTKAGQEVDLIIQGKKKRIAVEIKATASPSAKNFAGLNFFAEKYKPDASLLVCQVARPQKKGLHTIISWKDYAEHLEELLEK